MPIELGQISFDDDVFKQLRHDLRDDWFPDALEFQDMIDDGQVSKAIMTQFSANHGVYRPTKRALFNLPKPDHTLRYGLETGLPDRLVYHGLIAFLAPYFDPLIPWAVYNHRQTARPTDAAVTSDEAEPEAEASTLGDGKARRGLFRSPIRVWKDFVGSVVASLTPGTFLLTTDVANYYEHIDLGKLRAAFDRLLPSVSASPQEKDRIRRYLDVLFSCLSSWTYSDERGLPQNRDASSFLANVYMFDVDTRMIDAGYEYFRYMDDIKIVCGNEVAARRALKNLTLALRDSGLSVNSKKTKIVSSADHEKIGEELDAGDPTMQRLDYAWKSRALAPITRTIPHLKALALGSLANGSDGVHSREFRFCINRLTTLASCVELAVPKAYFAEITEKVVEAVETCAAATDAIVKYLRVAPTSDMQLEPLARFLIDDERSFYTWQNYRLWLLLLQKGYRSAELLAYACDVVRDRPDSAHRAGATLYIGGLGGEEERLVVAEHFSEVTSFIGQRSALIAIQELQFRKVKDHIVSNVRSDLMDVYRSLNSHRRGSYFTKPERVSIFHIIDAERDYV